MPLADPEADEIARLPERTCIVTRRAGTPATLIRFVAGPDGALVPDLRGKLPGRGAWVGASRALVEEAARRKLFAKGLRRQVAVPASLADDIDALLSRDALQALSMANKAGAVTTGFSKVEARIEKGGIAALVHAAEAADDGVRKLRQALKRTFGDDAVAIPVLRTFDERELSLAIGGAGVIHAALVAGPGSDGFLARWRRLTRFRGETDGESASAENGEPASAGNDRAAGRLARGGGVDGGTRPQD